MVWNKKMNKIINWLKDSKYITPLSPACKMCAKGSKMVVLVTGLCSADCFYCPLSKRKLGKDRIFANEWELKNEDDTKKLICEAEYINATGAGITGGDPLIVWERTKRYILILKDAFGTNFNIHLYTSGLKNYKHIFDLVAAGLDEIRFHPNTKYWSNMSNSPSFSLPGNWDHRNRRTRPAGCHIRPKKAARERGSWILRHLPLPWHLRDPSDRNRPASPQDITYSRNGFSHLSDRENRRRWSTSCCASTPCKTAAYPRRIRT